MTDLQKQFCHEYIIDYHITNAGKRAGIQGDNINITAWKMLQLEEVQEYISQLRSMQQSRTLVTADRVQAEIARLAFSDIRDYYTEGGSLKSPHELTDDAAAALASIEVDELWEDRAQVGVTKKIKLYDKLSALDKLARRLGMFKEDNLQQGTPIVLMQIDPLSDINATPANDSTQEDSGA